MARLNRSFLIEPELLEVRSGFLGRRRLLIPVERVEEIVPEQKLIILRARAPVTDAD
jgi:membrane protein YdbS with pleckstrin-like domain